MNAVATFQRTLVILHNHYNYNTFLVYLENINIFSKDDISHIADVDNIKHILS